ncbi:MAG: hypothetical protein AAF236_15075 [Verrucomicrobiota bacterium]
MKILLLFLTMLPLAAIAGSNEAIITGQSGSGRTEIRLSVQDISGSVNSISLSIDGESYEMKSFESETVVVDRDRGVFVLVAREGSKEVQFWMIPDSLRLVGESDNSESWEFRAIVRATDPRAEKQGLFAPDIELICKLDYEI